MTGQYSLTLKSATISQVQTLVPRLDYSNSLTSKVIDVIRDKKFELIQSNKILFESEEDDLICIRALELERTVSYSLETMIFIHKKLKGLSSIGDIPKTVPSLIPIIRTISAELLMILPESSLKLSELSVHLGSIAMDSASLTTAQFDFTRSNLESSMLLDEVKLMVDSKISKQYAHLDFYSVIRN